MSLLGKRYTYIQNGKSYEDGTFKHITKTILGFASTGALSYLAYKYGYGEVSSLFNQIDLIKHSMEAKDLSLSNDLEGNWAITTLVGVMIGGFVEGVVSEDKGRDFSFIKFLRNISVFPIVATGVTLFHEPHATEILLNSSHIVANFFGGAALAVLSTGVLVTPLFSKKIIDFSEDMVRKIPAFSAMTQKFNDYFEKRKEERLIQKNRKTLSSTSAISQIENKQHENANQSVEESILVEMGKTHHVLDEMLLLAKNKYHLQGETTYSLNQKLSHIYSKSEYIVKHSSLETLAYRQEVLSLYGSILPQIINSYEASLDNTNSEEKQSNTQKLMSGLNKIDEHFARLENIIREQNKQQKNMDFDEALQFAHARFQLQNDTNTIVSEESHHVKTLKMQ